MRLLAGTRPGADGLGMLPFFNGERTPDLPHARGSLYGLQLDNFTPANAYRAAMEGATYALRNGYDALCAADLNFDAIRLTGGGSHSAAWRQMVADVFELPVEVPAQVEGAAFGAALQALWACGTSGSANELTDIAREHVPMVPALAAQPDREAVAAYRNAYHQFQRHLQTAKSLYSAPAAGLIAQQPPALSPKDLPSMSLPFIGQREYFPGIGRIGFEGRDSTNPLAFKVYDAGKRIGGKTMARAPAFRGVLLAHLTNAGHDPFGPGTRRFPLGGRLATGHRREPRRRGVRVLQQARRAVLLLPRHRPCARCRGHRRIREEPAAHGGAGERAPGRHRREAAVGQRPTCSRIRAT